MDAAGIGWMIPFVWAKSKEAMPHMTEDTAREIIKQALEDETWDGTEPEDAKKAIEVAEELVQLAQDAFDQGVEEDEVVAILNIAKRDDDEDAPKPKAKAKPKPAPKGRPAKKEEPEPESEDEKDPRASDEPWEAYDDDAVKVVLDALDVWIEDDERDDLEHVLIYERANKNRKRIVEKIEEFMGAGEEPDAEPADDDEVEPEAEGDDEPAADEDPEEPFDDYDSLKASEIKEAIEDYLNNDEVDDDDKISTLNQTIAYESANKARTTLIDHLDNLLSKYTQNDDEEGTEEAEGEAEDSAPSDDDEGAKEESPRGKGRGKGSASKAAKGSSGSGAAADDDDRASGDTAYVVKAEIGDTWLALAADGKHAVAGMVLDLIERGDVTSISIDVS